MKKVIMTILVFPLLFSSCNKKLKDDVKELDSQVSDLKSKNDQLQNQLNGVESILGSDEPITATTSFVDDNNATRTVTDTYKFKAGNFSTQYMADNGDGTYEVYIERFSDVEWDEGTSVSFTYNPTTGAITDKTANHYWDWNLPYNDYAYYAESYGNCTVTITLSNINVTTGDISLSLSATSNATYAASYNWAVPNDGVGATTTFSFTGKLKVLPAN